MKSVACALLVSALLLLANPVTSPVIQPRPLVVYVLGDQKVKFPSRQRRRNHYSDIW